MADHLIEIAATEIGFTDFGTFSHPRWRTFREHLAMIQYGDPVTHFHNHIHMVLD
jgi:hypothetical protein